MPSRETTVCFTGHRPDKLLQVIPKEQLQLLQLELHNRILAAIDDGYTCFLSGMAEGVDLWAAELVLGLRRQFPHLELICVVPFPGQDKRWDRDARIRYQWVLTEATDVVVTGSHPDRAAFFTRNRYLVDHASRLIGVFEPRIGGGTGYTVGYAQKQGLQLELIVPSRLGK